MERKTGFTQTYVTSKTERGFAFTFFCDLCGEAYRAPDCETDAFYEALAISEREAKLHFNMCHKCGRWVCDRHYDEDEMMCVACTPQTSRREALGGARRARGAHDGGGACPRCHAQLNSGDCFCTVCGARIEMENAR